MFVGRFLLGGGGDVEVESRFGRSRDERDDAGAEYISDSSQ